jgi:tetratricopeptide (TPR) repeat protein
LEATSDLERLLKQDPEHKDWQAFLHLMQVRLGAIDTSLHTPGSSSELSRNSLAAMKELTRSASASADVFEQTADAMLQAEPASLRNPQFAVSCAERAVALSHQKMPSYLLTLARAYRAAGQLEKSRATANEGLALLPVPKPASIKPSIRKLLEIQTR